MLYVAGEIFLWMLLAFALGVLVGWFVWGVRQRKVATTKEALAAVAASTPSEIESVTVRPVPRAQMPPEPIDQLPVTPPAGTPVVPPAVAAARPPSSPAPDAVDAEAIGSETVAPPTAETPVVVVEAPPGDRSPEPEPAPEPGPEHEHDVVAVSPALASLLSDEPPPVRVPEGADLQVVEGIGPAIEGVLKESGISSLAELASATPDRLRTILDLAGDQYRVHDPETWPHQAELAAAGRWDDLTALQATLGNRPPG